MASQLGIDKLQFLLPVGDISFSPDFPATLHSTFDASTGEASGERLLYSAGDRDFYARRASLNTDNFNLSIVPHREGAEAVCIIHFSAGAYSDSNLEPLDIEGCMSVARHVESDLRSMGAQMELDKAKLTRLDIARNVELSHPVDCYGPVFAALSCRKKVDKMDFGGTGFLVGNKSWEIGFYDKGAEMEEKGHEKASCPVNTLRPELRLKKSATVRDALSCDSLADLPKQWGELSTAYRRHLTRDVFKPKEEAAIDRSLDAYEMAVEVVSGPSVRKWQAFTRHTAPMHLIQEMGLGMAKHFVADNLGFDADTEAGKKQVYRIHRELDRAEFALRNSQVASSGRKVKELHRELRGAVMSF